ncbi:MAG: ATP-dependent sacrificial sulfur transferase LarE [Myxococcales bacterium]|nr:ATP-dependent sacrificial sulfur transferase LarE [Myxococcales bacterium]
MLTEAQLAAICERSRPKLESMREAIRRFGSALVAYSGGVDSAFVLKVAHGELGGRAVALTALSPSIPAEEAQAASELARQIGARHLTVESKELDNPSYAANPVDRCYFCKSELFELCESKRAELGLSAVLDGFNADDRKDHRPGQTAARERKVRSPLAEAGLTKEEIRAWSRSLGLPTWDKPPMPCLASRIPYGTAVTAQRLSQIGGAEADLRALGLRTFRVRHHGEVARIEISAEEYPRFSEPSFRQRASELLRRRGFVFVALDLEPFRSGRMNEAARVKPEAVALPVLDG